MNKFKDFNINDDVKFYALVENMQKRFAQGNASYYSLTLSDGDQSVDSRVWNCNLVEYNEVTAGEVYYFEGHINEFNGKPQYVIKAIRKISDDEVDVKEFIKTAPLSEEDLVRGIAIYTKKIENKILYDLVCKLIKENKNKYFTYPAAVSMHHNFVNGLAYHTYSMLRISDTLLNIYPGMNKNLLYAGIILHDIGKTKELSGTKAPTYTEDGNLLGHIVIGLQMVAVAASELDVSDSEEVKALEHLIASHHGELEFGSPKEPGMMEAYALHLIDLTDSKMAAITPEVVKGKKGGQTAPISSLNRKCLYIPDID